MSNNQKLTLDILKEYSLTHSVYDTIDYASSFLPEYPTSSSIQKPNLKTNATYNEILEYAELVKEYEIKKADIDTKRTTYRELKIEIDSITTEYIKQEADLNSVPEQYRDKLYNYAYAKSHSNGFYSIYQELLDLIYIFEN